MAKMRENKYLCDMDFTQSDQCFRNKYDVNINTSTVHDSRVMLLLSRGGHLSVYQDGNISTDLVRNFCLRTDCFRDLFTQRYSSFSTAQGEVNLPHAALERVKLLSWLKTKKVLKGGEQSVRTLVGGCRNSAPNGRIFPKFCMEGSFVGLLWFLVKRRSYGLYWGQNLFSAILATSEH